MKPVLAIIGQLFKTKSNFTDAFGVQYLTPECIGRNLKGISTSEQFHKAKVDFIPKSYLPGREHEIAHFVMLPTIKTLPGNRYIIRSIRRKEGYIIFEMLEN